jgi:hypothetical protein
MANPFSITPANPLQALMMGVQGYDRGKKSVQDSQLEEARKLAAETILSGGDSKAALARLIQGGDIQGANAVANFGNQTATQDYQRGMLRVAEQNANRQETPSDVQKLKAAGIVPGTPEAAKALFPRTDTPLSVTDKKIITDAENDVPRIEATIKNVMRAKELNPNVFTGLTASTRGMLGTSGIPGANLIFDKGASEATAEWDQVMGGEAIKNMSETLKGASTDFEMKKFISIAADTSKPPKVREAAMDRFLDLAKAELSLRNKRAADLRTGDYFKPQGAKPAQSAADPLALARDAIAKGADPNAVRQRLQQNGIDPSGL